MSDIEVFKERLAANVAANQRRRQDSWNKRDSYFNEKDKLVAEMKEKGIKHTHGDCLICKAIEDLNKSYEY